MAKILIVDDSNMSRRIMRSILEPAAHEVIEARDGMAALERYFVDRPELVILDLTMAGISGLQVLVKLREIDPQARVLVASADVQNLTRIETQQAGAVGFIAKPLVPDRVLNAVNTVLSGGNIWP